MRLQHHRPVGTRRRMDSAWGYEPKVSEVAVLAPIGVQDPDGDAWWDPALSPEQVRTRIAGLARVLESMPERETPREWLAAERQVLARLRLRAAVEERRREDEQVREPLPGETREESMVRLSGLGMSQRQVAAAVGCAQGTVSKTLRRLGAGS